MLGLSSRIVRTLSGTSLPHQCRDLILGLGFWVQIHHFTCVQHSWLCVSACLLFRVTCDIVVLVVCIRVCCDVAAPMLSCCRDWCCTPMQLALFSCMSGNYNPALSFPVHPFRYSILHVCSYQSCIPLSLCCCEIWRPWCVLQLHAPFACCRYVAIIHRLSHDTITGSAKSLCLQTLCFFISIIVVCSVECHSVPHSMQRSYCMRNDIEGSITVPLSGSCGARPSAACGHWGHASFCLPFCTYFDSLCVSWFCAGFSAPEWTT